MSTASIISSLEVVTRAHLLNSFLCSPSAGMEAHREAATAAGQVATALAHRWEGMVMVLQQRRGGIEIQSASISMAHSRSLRR